MKRKMKIPAFKLELVHIFAKKRKSIETSSLEKFFYFKSPLKRKKSFKRTGLQ